MPSGHSTSVATASAPIAAAQTRAPTVTTTHCRAPPRKELPTGAIVYFWPDPPTDTVGHLADTLLVGLLPDQDFAGWYDILRAERPVKVFYIEGGASGPVFHIGVGTDRRLWVRAPATSIPDQD
jgi:hypothetical protein